VLSARQVGDSVWRVVVAGVAGVATARTFLGRRMRLLLTAQDTTRLKENIVAEEYAACDDNNCLLGKQRTSSFIIHVQQSKKGK
jgi:hypothetical protein